MSPTHKFFSNGIECSAMTKIRHSCRYQMALDMGAPPSIIQLAGFGLIVLATWALGLNFNAKFRLVGPWRLEIAGEPLRGELWAFMRRRRSSKISESSPPFSSKTGIAIFFWVCGTPSSWECHRAAEAVVGEGGHGQWHHSGSHLEVLGSQFLDKWKDDLDI